jgi:AcrR family transcriptional regulator
MSVTKHFGGDDRKKPAREGAAIDRRAIRTRDALHRTLIGMIAERDYDSITVAEIADAANVGRSTFYAHFTDKDDLLRSGTVHLRSLLRQEHASAVAGEGRPDRRALGFSRFMTDHLRERRQLFRALMRGRAGPIIVEQIRQAVCELVRAELTAAARASGDDVRFIEVAVQFVVGAYMSVVVWWLERGCKERPEEIDRSFRELAVGGLNSLFARRSS